MSERVDQWRSFEALTAASLYSAFIMMLQCLVGSVSVERHLLSEKVNFAQSNRWRKSGKKRSAKKKNHFGKFVLAR